MDPRHTSKLSLSQRRASLVDMDQEAPARSVPQPLSVGNAGRSADVRSSLSTSHPKPLPTPGKSMSPLPHNLLPSAPASPPTPAPSPTPHQRPPSWNHAEDDHISFFCEVGSRFRRLNAAQRELFLREILNHCDNQQLSWISCYVSPLLKKDPFLALPNELCLRVIHHR